MLGHEKLCCPKPKTVGKLNYLHGKKISNLVQKKNIFDNNCGVIHAQKHILFHISYNIHKLVLVVTWGTVIVYLFKNIFVKTLIGDCSDYAYPNT